MQPSPGPGLVGRDEQLRLLADELDAAHYGGRVVGLLGDPGIGKSALQQQAAQDARSLGFTVLTAQGRQPESQLPFAGLHQLLRPLLPRADRLPPRQRDALLACFGMGETSEINPFFTGLAVLEMLADCAAEAPVLVCLDDLHWMDQPSIDALSFVARRIAGEQVVILATTRNDVLALGDDHRATLIRLPALDDAAAVALLAARTPAMGTALSDRIRRQAGGNPLALVEFAAASPAAEGEPDESLPMTDRLERAFAGRADELDAAARAVLDLAALDDGAEVDELLAAAGILTGAPVELAAVQPALGLGLLGPAGGGYRVSHPLVRSALRSAMPAAARQRAHAALATVLAGQPERAVWHRASAAAGPDEQLAAELERAAVAAHRRGATSSALSWLERAAALSPQPDARAGRLLSAAEFAYELGRFAQVEQITARVAGLPLGARARSRLTWLEGVFHDGSTSDPAEIAHLVTLAGAATGDADPDLALQLLIGAARRVWWRDPGEKIRREIVRAAVTTAVAEDDPRVLAVLALCEPIAMAPVIIDHLARRPAEPDGPPEADGLLGIAAFCVGDHRRAAAYLSAPVGQLRAQGRIGRLAEVLALRAWSEINLGRFDISGSADEAMRLADETGQAVWAATARIAVALMSAVGPTATARPDLLTEAEQTATQVPNASSSLLAAVQLARGLAALGADHAEPAYDELHRVFVPSDPAHQQVQQLWTVSYLADAAVRTGRRQEARSVLSAMEQLAGPSPTLGPLIALEYARAVLADPDTAEAQFQDALAGAGRPFPWHRARLELAYGSWLRRQRRVLDSRAPLRAARGAFDALGAHAWARRADQELRATGERGWRPTANPREQLSPQETQIAELAAQGLSNREIGERLFLSHRTVSSHLYRLFPKLGVTSRGQLAGALAVRPAPVLDPGPAVI